jgi:hypothetical protein
MQAILSPVAYKPPLWLHHAALVLLVAVASLLLIPNSGKMFFSGDDDDYFSVSTAIAFGQFPSFKKEFHAGERMPFASVGPGVMAAPIVALASVIDRKKKAPIVKERTRENREGSWSVVGFFLASQIYLVAGTLLLYNLACMWTERRSAFYSVLLLLVAGGGIFAYAFIRPVMSHVYEFFSITVALWAISKIHFGDQSKGIWLILGTAISFVFLTRYNNAPISIALTALTFLWALAGKVSKRDFLLCTSVQVALVGLLRVLPIFANGFSNADQGYLDAGVRLFMVHDLDFYYQRLVQILLGIDMGVIFTAPALLIAMIAFAFHWGRLPLWYSLIAMLFLINVFITAQWCSTGSFYGYRYFAFTAMPLLAVFLAQAIQPLVARISQFSTLLLVCMFGLYSFSSLLLFGLKGGFSLDSVQTICGFPAYGNPDYHTNVLRIVGSDPAKAFILGFERSFGGFLERESLDSLGRQKLVLFSCSFILFIGVILKHLCSLGLVSLRTRSKGSFG